MCSDIFAKLGLWLKLSIQNRRNLLYDFSWRTQDLMFFVVPCFSNRAIHSCYVYYTRAGGVLIGVLRGGDKTAACIVRHRLRLSYDI